MAGPAMRERMRESSRPDRIEGHRGRRREGEREGGRGGWVRASDSSWGSRPEPPARGGGMGTSRGGGMDGMEEG